MKLIPLPNGAFIDPTTVTAVTPYTRGPSFSVVVSTSPPQQIMCETPEQAKELAATLARQVNDACNSLATGSTPELRSLFTHARLAQLDNLVTAALETRNAEPDEGEELFTWIDSLRKTLLPPATGSTPAPDNTWIREHTGDGCDIIAYRIAK